MTKTIEDTTTSERRSDVVVIGGGLAGLAACIHLARAGLSVLCLEPLRKFDHIVGESLDWSAPELFAELDLQMEEMVQSQASTFKRHVVLQLKDGSLAEYIPSPWLGRQPFNIELRTIHVDRARLHHDLMRLAAAQGVEIVHDKASGIERLDERISAVRTAQQMRLVSSWFIDASGSSTSFLARELNLTSIEYGPRKVGMWTYFTTSEWQEGTTLYAEPLERHYMDWIWEIPIRPGSVSVGYVVPGSTVKEQRSQGLSIEEIFTRQLSGFPRFKALLECGKVPPLKVTSFTCHSYTRVCGSNWFIIGEAASLPDPITGNGVTAALRHASEASRLILKFKKRGRISFWARAAYNLRVLQMGKFFNSLIEKLAYDWPVRDRLGLLTAGDTYTIPAWSINVLYSRLRPSGMVSTVLFSLLLGSLRAAVCIFYWVCKQLSPSTQLAENSAS